MAWSGIEKWLAKRYGTNQKTYKGTCVNLQVTDITGKEYTRMVKPRLLYWDGEKLDDGRVRAESLIDRREPLQIEGVSLERCNIVKYQIVDAAEVAISGKRFLNKSIYSFVFGVMFHVWACLWLAGSVSYAVVAAQSMGESVIATLGLAVVSFFAWIFSSLMVAGIIEDFGTNGAWHV